LHSEPITNRVQQGVGDLLVVDTLEEAEESAVLTVVFVVRPVENGGYAPAHFTRPVREKSLSLPRFIKRVRLVSHETFLDSPEWRNPMRVVPVESPGKLQELLLLSARSDRFDKHTKHTGLSPKRPKEKTFLVLPRDDDLLFRVYLEVFCFSVQTS
jgi:hypothetical protein